VKQLTRKATVGVGQS